MIAGAPGAAAAAGIAGVKGVCGLVVGAAGVGGASDAGSPLDIGCVLGLGGVLGMLAALAAAAGWAAWALLRAARRRRLLEDDLRASEERFRSLAELAVDSVVTVDSAGIIVFVNPAAERLSRYSAADLVGRSCTLLVPEFLRGVLSDELSRYLQTGRRSLSWEGVRTLAMDRDGQEIPVEVTYTESHRGGQRFFTAVARHLSSPPG